MRVIVLVKQVPDMERVKFDTEKGVIDRKSAGTEINPFDLNALETALQIGEKTNSEIIVLSMGPHSAEQSIRDAISRGAHKGILLNDKKFSGSDVKATSVTICAGIKKIGNFDLIIAGMQSVDGDTGQVGAEIAQILKIPHISFVEKLNDFDYNSLTVTSNIWEGIYLKKVKLPALITVTKDINIPRLPSFKNKMLARNAEVAVWGYDDLEEHLEESQLGFKGSPTKVKKIVIPKSVNREGKMWREDYSHAVDSLIEVFKCRKILEV